MLLLFSLLFHSHYFIFCSLLTSHYCLVSSTLDSSLPAVVSLLSYLIRSQYFLACSVLTDYFRTEQGAEAHGDDFHHTASALLDLKASVDASRRKVHKQFERRQ